MEGDSKNENENENGENETVDLTLTLGSPYPSRNVRPARQQPTNHGQMTNGGGSSSSINRGSIDANMNPLSHTNYVNRYHPFYNVDGALVIDMPLMTPNPHANFTMGNEGIGGSRRRGTNVYPNRRCSNADCNTTDTPMWRKGPLGPKTLCNACGIKYRKEELSKAAGEPGTSSTGDS